MSSFTPPMISASSNLSDPPLIFSLPLLHMSMLAVNGAHFSYWMWNDTRARENDCEEIHRYISSFIRLFHRVVCYSKRKFQLPVCLDSIDQRHHYWSTTVWSLISGPKTKAVVTFSEQSVFYLPFQECSFKVKRKLFNVVQMEITFCSSVFCSGCI